MEQPVNENNITPPQEQASSEEDSILVNTIDKLNSPHVYFFIAIIVGILTIFSCIILFTKPGFTLNLSWLESIGLSINTTLLGAIGTTLIIMSIISIILLLYTKTFKAVFQILDKLVWVFTLLIFILGLALFFIYIKKEVLNHYKYLILILVLGIGFKLFYNALQQTDEEQFRPNLQVEKIRFSLVYFAFFLFTILLFVTDLGGLRSNYAGQSFIFTLVLLGIGLVYLLNLLSFPIGGLGSKNEDKSMFSGITLFGWVHIGLFLLTIVGFIVGIFTNKKKFVDADGKFSIKNVNFATICAMFTVIMVLWIAFFVVRSTNAPDDNLTGSQQAKLTNVSNIAQQAINVVLGITLLGVIIGWSITLAENYKKDKNTMALIVNITTILVIVYFSYKFLKNSTQFQKSPYFKLIVNLIFYIPCLIYELFAWVLLKIGIKLPPLNELISGAKGTNIGSRNDLIMLLIIIFINVVYFLIFPYTVNKFAKQGGNVLRLMPVSLSDPQTLGTYFKLNGIEVPKGKPIQEVGIHNYRYAISFWVYLPSLQQSNNNEYLTILNYEEIPHVKWNTKSSELIVTVKAPNNFSENDLKYPEELDTEGNIILYKSNTFKTQVWNNIVLNFDGGTMDIFINGELVKNRRHVVPEITYGTLVCGTPKLAGKICNIIYFNFALTMKKIHYLYNLVKFNDPPIPLNTSLGSTEQAIYGAVDKDNKKTVIPINLETDIFDKLSFDDPVEETDKLTSARFRNYLSLGWYFKQNKDGNNSIYSGGMGDSNQGSSCQKQSQTAVSSPFSESSNSPSSGGTMKIK